jgi:uncharacterized membrane protein YccC
MKNRLFFSVLVLLLVPFLQISAQNQHTRFQKQHHTNYTESHLKQSEAMLLKAFESDVNGMATSSLQTLRQLQQVFPEYEFTSLLEPLIKLVGDEKLDTHERMLAALALDDLHSDKGDKAISNAAKNTINQSVKDICLTLAEEEALINTAMK